MSKNIIDALSTNIEKYMKENGFDGLACKNGCSCYGIQGFKECEDDFRDCAFGKLKDCDRCKNKTSCNYSIFESLHDEVPNQICPVCD